MDGRILANSLVALKGTELRLVYALLCETNIGDLMTSKTKDFFSKKEQDHFSKHLEEEVKKLNVFDDATLQVNLFLEMTKLLKLRGSKYTLQKEIEDQCAMIVQEVYEQYKKQDKQFCVYTEKEENTSTNLQQMIKFQMSKMFRQLDGSFQDFSIDDQTKFASQVNEYIQSLPEEKQAKIKEKLGINDLTDEMVRKAIATSGTSIVFAIIVEVNGFAFYTTATSLVASFAGLFGLTLPFGFYTGITSTIAVLASPFFIIPLLLGGGALPVNHQNKSLKKKLLPIVVMQITLPYMGEGDDHVQFSDFLEEWDVRYRNYQSVKNELKEIETKQMQARRQINEHIARINHCNTQIANHLVKQASEKQKIKLALKRTDLNRLTISPSFNEWKNKYQEVSAKISNLTNEKRNRPNETGFFNKIGSKIKGFTLSINLSGEEKKLDSILDEMALEVLYSTGSFMSVEREQYLAIDQQIHSLKTSKEEEEAEKRGQERIVADLKSEHQSWTQNLKRLEKEHYGLSDLAM